MRRILLLVLAVTLGALAGTLLCALQPPVWVTPIYICGGYPASPYCTPPAPTLVGPDALAYAIWAIVGASLAGGAAWLSDRAMEIIRRRGTPTPSPDSTA